MKKSNLVLVFVVAGMFALLGFTKIVLNKKFVANDVDIITWQTLKRPNDVSGGSTVVVPAFNHIKVIGSGAYGQVQLIDSAYIDKKGQPAALIAYTSRTDKYEKDENAVFTSFKGDTLILNCINIKDVKVYIPDIESVTGELSSGQNILLSGFNQDKIKLKSGHGVSLSMNDCRFKYCSLTITTAGVMRIGGDQNIIDTLSLYVDAGGELTLWDYGGEFRDVYLSDFAKLELTGQSIVAFSKVKWENYPIGTMPIRPE